MVLFRSGRERGARRRDGLYVAKSGRLGKLAHRHEASSSTARVCRYRRRASCGALLVLENGRESATDRVRCSARSLQKRAGEADRDGPRVNSSISPRNTDTAPARPPQLWHLRHRGKISADQCPAETTPRLLHRTRLPREARTVDQVGRRARGTPLAPSRPGYSSGFIRGT